jgi:GNAT superfamily N-acetyltransferase
MKHDPTIREYRTEDRKGIFALKEAVDGVPFDEQLWNWKFEKGPIGPAKIYVADYDGMIVGLRAFIIEGLKVMDQSWKTGLGVDILVHPDFRRYGIASKMSEEAYNLMNEEGIYVMVGFPNEAAYQVYRRRRPYWRHVCSPPLLAKPLSIDGLFDKYVGNPLLRKLGKPPTKVAAELLLRQRLHKSGDAFIKRIYSFDSRFDDFWEAASAGYNLGLIRDRRFLNWRFVDKPGEEYFVLAAEHGGKILGYAVLKNAEMFNLTLGLIVDILTLAPNNVIDCLISRAIEHFREQNVDAVGCLMLKHSVYSKALRRAGFVQVPKALSHKEFYFGVQVKPSVLADEIVNNPTNWLITWGDTDIA